ncbi:MAG: hypothetical protein MUF32_05025 [Burkholderiaceae bacterium]|jgi:predicted lipid-binding transport protein (Tim44 family)|nr:hypothetical protein [Burkholderiaceae bacterium]
MLDAREPPRGDFVAYVEKIEREQLARAMQPHRLPQPPAGGTDSSEGARRDETRTLSAAEATRLLQTLAAQGKGAAPAARGAMVGVVLGAALIAFGMLAEGGIVLVIVGALLLWHGMRRLRRAETTAAEPARQQVDRAFGQTPRSASRRRDA